MASAHRSSFEYLYPQWQPLYQAAILESDAKKLPDRSHVAQDVITARLHVMSAANAESEPERVALHNALHALEVLLDIYA